MFRGGGILIGSKVLWKWGDKKILNHWKRDWKSRRKFIQNTLNLLHSTFWWKNRPTLGLSISGTKCDRDKPSVSALVSIYGIIPNTRACWENLFFVGILLDPGLCIIKVFHVIACRLNPGPNLTVDYVCKNMKAGYWIVMWSWWWRPIMVPGQEYDSFFFQWSERLVSSMASQKRCRAESHAQKCSEIFLLLIYSPTPWVPNKAIG